MMFLPPTLFFITQNLVSMTLIIPLVIIRYLNPMLLMIPPKTSESLLTIQHFPLLTLLQPPLLMSQIINPSHPSNIPPARLPLVLPRILILCFEILDKRKDTRRLPATKRIKINKILIVLLTKQCTAPPYHYH